MCQNQLEKISADIRTLKDTMPSKALSMTLGQLRATDAKKFSELTDETINSSSINTTSSIHNTARKQSKDDEGKNNEYLKT